MLGFYYSTDNIMRNIFIVTVSVIHCWLCYSTNHNSALCHLHTAPPGVYSVTQSLKADGLCQQHKTIAKSSLNKDKYDATKTSAIKATLIDWLIDWLTHHTIRQPCSIHNTDWKRFISQFWYQATSFKVITCDLGISMNSIESYSLKVK